MALRCALLLRDNAGQPLLKSRHSLLALLARGLGTSQALPEDYKLVLHLAAPGAAGRNLRAYVTDVSRPQPSRS